MTAFQGAEYDFQLHFLFKLLPSAPFPGSELWRTRKLHISVPRCDAKKKKKKKGGVGLGVWDSPVSFRQMSILDGAGGFAL